MKISLLKEREDFENIFFKSLSSYLKARYSWSGVISIVDKQGAKFSMNPLLNIIFHENVSAEILRPVVAEFSYHPNLIRRILQYSYIALAISPFRKLFSSTLCYISMFPDELINSVILPGNHTIRIVQKNSCVVIKKTGFSEVFFDRDCEVRKVIEGINFPKILQADLPNGWYEEQRIIGLPINRIDSDRAYQVCLTKAFQQADLIATIDHNSISAMEYAESLVNTAHDYLALDKFSEIREVSRSFIDRLTSLMVINTSSDCTISVSLSHGDFQAANLIFDGHGVSIIDWEYSTIRVCGYDHLVLYCDLRNIHGYSDRVIKFIASTEQPQNTNVHLQAVLKNYEIFFPIFLLEEIVLRLKELNSVPNIQVAKEFNPWLSEYSCVANTLSKQDE